MISQRTLRLLSKLAARDLASAERKVADALAKAQMLARDADLIATYTRNLAASRHGQTSTGYEFSVTTRFVAESLKAQGMAEAALQRGEQAKVAAFDRLAVEMQRRDALDTASDGVATVAAHARERMAERMAPPSPVEPAWRR